MEMSQNILVLSLICIQPKRRQSLIIIDSWLMLPCQTLPTATSYQRRGGLLYDRRAIAPPCLLIYRFHSYPTARLILVRIIMLRPRLRTSSTSHTRRTRPIRSDGPSRRIDAAHSPTPSMRLIIRRPNSGTDGTHSARQRWSGTACYRSGRAVHLGDADLLDEGRLEFSALIHQGDTGVEEGFARGDVGFHCLVGLYTELYLVRERMWNSVAGEEDVIVKEKLAEDGCQRTDVSERK